jgi:predicted lysophospholipase L1 biosynthesis ABC-type transport system permease subunit
MATDSFTTQPNQNVWTNLAYGTAGIIIAFNLAVAAPLLNTLGQGAEFFVAHDASRKEIIGLALLFVAIIPLCIATLIAASRLVRPEIYSIIVQIILSTLMAIWVMGFVKNLSEVLSGSMQLVIALSGGVAIVLISNKWKHTQNLANARSSLNFG